MAFHANQVLNRGEKNALASRHRGRVWDCLSVLRADLFVEEYEMHGGTGLRIFCVNEHIHIGRVPIHPAGLASRLDNLGEVPAIYSRINVGRKPGAKRISLRNVKKNCKAAHNAVGHTSSGQKRVELLDAVKQLFPVSVKRRSRQHGLLPFILTRRY